MKSSKRRIFSLAILSYLLICNVALSLEFAKIKDFLDEESDSDTSRPELDEFTKRFGDVYGYDGKLDSIRREDVKRFKGAVYMDNTGAGVYRESQIRQCMRSLETGMFGNSHSRNPSSMNTEHMVESTRDMILEYFHATPAEYSVVFTSGATGALHTVGEIFPWSKDSKFYYLSENHNSVLGIREYAFRFGSGFQSLNEEDMPTAASCLEVDPSLDALYGYSKKNFTYSLFAYPAQDNFAGVKYPMDWIQKVQDGYFKDGSKWLVMLDAAAFVPTNRLNLTRYKPDFVSISFYKMFGFPTGVGALILKNSNIHLLNKLYWGGGSVVLASENEHFCIFQGRPCNRFEDGTLNFLSILCLRYGFDSIQQLGIENINKHVWSLTRFMYEKLSALRHSNGERVVEIYGKHSLDSPDLQGGVIACNVKRKDGSFRGYYDVQTESAKKNIHLRTGCHCNPGACRKYLQQPKEVFEVMSLEKDSCGDSFDTFQGVPLGGIRLSLGYLTSFNDIMAVVDFFASYIE